jgi:hypothetical protein
MSEEDLLGTMQKSNKNIGIGMFKEMKQEIKHLGTGTDLNQEGKGLIK